MSASVADAAAIRGAYQHCEQVTRTQARNFSYGIRLLPPDKRRALSAVYALARRIDDIGDGTLPAEQKLTALGEVRAQLGLLASEGGSASDGTLAREGGSASDGTLASEGGSASDGTLARQGGSASDGTLAGQASLSGPGGPGDPVLVAIADAASRYPIPLSSFGELIDGCEADVRGTVYGTFSELEHYCRCVAGSIGRLSLSIFGSREPGVAEPLADALGVALQLTNILRDIREDFGIGRVYLPADDLARFGCSMTPDGRDGQAGLRADAALEQLVRYEAQRALRWYDVGLRLMPLLDRRSAACTGAMAGIYLRLLEQISADPAAALARRVSVPARAKAMVAVRSLAGLAPRPAGRPGPVGQDTMTAEEATP